MALNSGLTKSITAAKLSELLAQCRADDVLLPNQVGNLSIIRGGEYIGVIDLATEEVMYFIGTLDDGIQDATAPPTLWRE